MDSHGTEIHRPVDVGWKSSRRSRDTNGVVPLSSLYTPEKYRNAMRQIYGDHCEQCHSRQSTDDRSDTNSCADNWSRSVENYESLNRVADSVNGNNPDLQGKCTLIVFRLD